MRPPPVPPAREAPASRLARLGLGADTGPRLRRLGLAGHDLAAVLARGADPPAALRAFEALAERSTPAWQALCDAAERHPRGLAALSQVAVLAGASDALAGLLVTDPGLLAVVTGTLARHDAARTRALAALALSSSGEHRGRALARSQRRGLARIALRDLTGLAEAPPVAGELGTGSAGTPPVAGQLVAGATGTPAVTGELSELAEGVIAAALDEARRRLATDVPLAVIGMGKLGGGELNYVSDVDLLFVGEGDLPAAARLAEATFRLAGEVTPAGRAYELDANLRPEGRDGPLVRSLDGYRTYYERWAATWEFQALLKARPIAGDAALGGRFVELVTPLVWPDRRGAQAVADIQRLKGVVEGSKAVVRSGGREMKLAPGGLRDVEFSVQLLQLVHGRHDPSLRARGTLPALAALASAGLVGPADAAALADAYVWLRTVEHRLQLRSLRRTHALPADPAALQRLARTLGYADAPDATAAERFSADLRKVRAEVRRVHEKLFYRPLLGRFAEVGAGDLVAAPADGLLDRDAVTDRLAALGFTDPGAALAALEALTRGTSRRARLLRVLLPAVLPAMAATPDPDGGLAALRSLSERLDASPALLAVLRDRPPVAERLATVLGRSPRVGRWLERQPEVLSGLADDAALEARRTRDDYHRLARGLVARHDDEPRVADALRRVARREVARTAIRDVLGYADPTDVAEELSGLAAACLETAVATVTPPDVTLAVIGMGKLGGRDLGYGSDLDVLVVFEPADAREEALRSTSRLLRLLSDPTVEGRAFAVDPNLRPEGRDGALARTLGSYQTYYERWGQPWELQALTQARPVAGDRALGRAFVEVLAATVYPPVVPPERLTAVRDMQSRVETERRRAAGGEVIDLKFGPGGLTTVEWTVQLLQLAHGGRLPRLRRRGTLAALAACEAEGLLDAGEAGVLREGYALGVRLRNLTFLVGRRQAGTLPTSGPELAHVAALLDPADPDPAALLARLTTLRTRVVTVAGRILGDRLG